MRVDKDAGPIVSFDSDPVPLGDGVGPCDMLILPPSLAPPISVDAAAPVAKWLRERHNDGSILASICAGAFLLAETGLIAGRAVTTHWGSADAFRERFQMSFSILIG
nr:DJ-1/PfpI family protein [Agrobacterium burrii]